MNNCKEFAFVGVDISKSFFDVCFLDAKGQFVQQRTNQTPKGYRQLASAIREDAAICVMEATSTYHLPLALWLYNHGYKLL